MAVNGRKYDWESIEVMLPTGIAISMTDIHYEDGQDIELRYGKGSVARGYGNKNYEPSGSFVIDRDGWEPLKAVLAATGGGKIYNHEPFPIIVSYQNDDMPLVVDTLPLCKITKFSGAGAAQGDDNASPMTCEFKILKPILWNGIPAK